MYPAIFSRTYAAKTAEEVFNALLRDGYAGAQMNLSSLGFDSLPEQAPVESAAAAGIAARAMGVKLPALSGTYNMAHPEAGYREKMRPRFRNVLAAARAMGAPIVTLCTGSRNVDDMWQAHADNQGLEAWNDLCREMAQALRMAEELGLVLAIEPEPGNVICDAQTARRFLAEMNAPHLKIILDAANLLNPEQLENQHRVMQHAMDTLGGDTVLAHAKDFDETGKVVAPGTGVVDLHYFANALRNASYTGPLVSHGFQEAETEISAKFLAALCD